MEIDKVVVPVGTSVILREVVSFENLREYFDRASGVLGSVFAKADVAPRGFRAYTFGMPEGALDIAAGFTVSEEDVDKLELEEGVTVFRHPEVKALRGVLRGSYDQLAGAWRELEKVFGANGLAPGALCFEDYLNMPGDTPEEDLITHLVWEIA